MDRYPSELAIGADVCRHIRQQVIDSRFLADATKTGREVVLVLHCEASTRFGKRDSPFRLERRICIGGADITFECVGRADSLSDAVRFTREGGVVVAVGMPGDERVDWAAIWQRELTVMGAYAYGSEPKRKGQRTFELALEAAPELRLERLVAPLFSLGDYRDAIAYAMSAGRLGAVKVAFDLRGLRA